MAYYVADSYKGYKYDETKAYDKSGKMYVHATRKCDRCVNGVYACRVENGQIVPHPAYNGVCLACGGTGIQSKEIRLYTEKEKATMDKTAAARSKKKEAEAQARITKLAADSEKNKLAWFAKNGIGEDGSIYIICGDNTYAIKDKLKELGCRFSPALKWYSPIDLELPEGYSTLHFSFDDLYEWVPNWKNATLRPDAEKKIAAAIEELAGPSLSEYVGEIGERLYNMTAVFVATRGWEGRYGYTYIHTFRSGENVLTWFTSKDLNLDENTIVDLTATVKSHDEYKGVKNTQVTRCIVKTIA